MRPTNSRIDIGALAVVFWSALAVNSPGAEMRLSGNSGGVQRTDAIVRTEIPAKSIVDRFGENAIEPSKSGTPWSWSIVHEDRPGDPRPVEVEKQGEVIRLTWVEPGSWPSGVAKHWTLKKNSPADSQSPWIWKRTPDSQLELHHATRGLVFRYRAEPENRPGLPPTQNRGAYIHPFLTPSGQVATGDFSPFHTHHRGFFLAYAKTAAGAHHPDFWNIHAGTAKIVSRKDSIRTIAGPVTARLIVKHDWQLRDKEKPENDSGTTVAEEGWDISVYDVPGQPSWVWDIESTQTPQGEDLVLVKHRYGGMAYRGPEPFVKGKLDVLTSEGALTRAAADQKPARWIDLTGPVADGSADYVGAVMCDHPANARFPNVVRIHPTLLPFFSFVPAHRADLTLKAGEPATWRYRTMVHDGHPDRARNQALFDDYAAPVVVEVLD